MDIVIAQWWHSAGGDEILAAIAIVWAAAVNKLVYPAVRTRRPVDGDADDATGAFYVPRSLHWFLVGLVTLAVTMLLTLFVDRPPLHVVLSGCFGAYCAIGGHEVMKGRKAKE